MRDHLLSMYQYTLDQARQLVGDVPGERFAEMPHEGAKHPGWVLGHLCLASGMGAATLDPDPAQRDGICGVPESWMQSCMHAPTSERRAYGAKDELLAHLERTHELMATRLRKSSDALLAEPFPNPDYRGFWPTIGHGAFYLMAYHEGYHLGQLSMWRRALEMPAPG